MSNNLHIACVAMLALLILLPTLTRWAMGIQSRAPRSHREQKVLDRCTQILAGSLLIDAPLLRTLRDYLAQDLPILHMAIWDDSHQVSTGPSKDLGSPSFAVPFRNTKGEIQVWLAQHNKHRRTEKTLFNLLPWIQAALRSSSSFQKTQFEAITDPLTGLGNRRMIHLERRRYREDGSCFGLLLLDLNDFKAINDTWDHQVGDEALLRFTHILRTCTRHSDSVIRLGGDEFLIVAKDTDAEGMQLLAERISLMSHRHRLELPNGQQHRISSAYGWACYPADGDEWEVLIALADQRMYSHKASMKSSVA